MRGHVERQRRRLAVAPQSSAPCVVPEQRTQRVPQGFGADRHDEPRVGTQTAAAAPAASVQTTGTLAAIASMTGMPHTSLRDGKAKTSASQ